MFALRANEPVFVFLLSVATLFACKKASLDETIAKHRTGVEAKFAALKTLEPIVSATPELESSSVKAPAEPLILEREGGGQNATYVYQEDLKDPGDGRLVDLRTLRSKLLPDCGQIIRNKKYFDSTTDVLPKVADDYLAKCAGLKYVLVIRTREYRSPEVIPAEKKFVTGKYRADVLAFQLDGAKYLGGYKVEAENNETVSVNEKEDTSERLKSNLSATVFVGLDDATRKHFPGSLPAK